VICGDGDGTINIFNWDLWEDITDRFPSHPQSVDCIVKITEDVVCTACMDGMIRWGNWRGGVVLSCVVFKLARERTPFAWGLHVVCLFLS